MSEPTRLKVHYSVGIVRQGPYGFNLSGFQQVSMVHPDVENAQIGDVLHWLTGSLSLDPEVCSVVVHGLWSRSAMHIQWVLTRLMRTVAWKSFLEGCRRRGYECVLLVQACLKGVVGGPIGGYRRVRGSSLSVQRMVHEEDAVVDVAEAKEDAVTDVAEAKEDVVTNVAEVEEK